MNLLISVIVPVYNVEQYLDECLASLSAQQWTDFEALLVNDGSTDGSPAILDAWAERDSRFRVIQRPNGGLSAARNTGIAASQGRYLAFVDSDDVIDPSYLSGLLEAQRRAPGSIAVCDMEYFDETGARSFSSGGSFQEMEISSSPQLIRINNSACNKLFERELFSDIQFPEGKYYEDLATVPILLFKAGKAVKADQALYFYRQRRGSIAHRASPKIFEIYDAIDGVIRYLKDHGIAGDDPLLREARHLYIIHGLDLTTLRIRSFDDRSIRADYLRRNMARLMQSYPDYAHDSSYIEAPFKKKMIWKLLRHHQEELVLRLYD